jgi:hypothetical protein
MLWETIVIFIFTLPYSLSQLPRNPLLLRRKYGPSSSFVHESATADAAAAAAASAAEAARFVLMGQINSDFHNAVGIHLGIMITHQIHLYLRASYAIP